MSIISNTGPLVILAKIDHLWLLQQMFSHVGIPQAVHRELMAKSGAEVARLDAALTEFIEVNTDSKLPSEVEMITKNLDSGEQQAINLAFQRGLPLIIDERLGRRAARQLGIKVTGSIGILIEAKKRGHISAVKPLLESARHQGYWLSDELIAIAMRLASETA